MMLVANPIAWGVLAFTALIKFEWGEQLHTTRHSTAQYNSTQHITTQDMAQCDEGVAVLLQLPLLHKPPHHTAARLQAYHRLTPPPPPLLHMPFCTHKHTQPEP
jgi:hypothetical protein